MLRSGEIVVAAARRHWLGCLQSHCPDEFSFTSVVVLHSGDPLTELLSLLLDVIVLRRCATILCCGTTLLGALKERLRLLVLDFAIALM